jgi:hypothetical protein
LRVKQTASSSSIDQDQKIKIWPQPAKGLLNISVNNQHVSSLKIFDAIGRCLLIKYCSGEEFFSLNTDEISPGIYILQLSMKQGISNHKIIFQ